MSGWITTSDLSDAIAAGYVGEAPVRPKLVSNLVRFEFRRKWLPVWTVFYCGLPDERLRKRFGYTS